MQLRADRRTLDIFWTARTQIPQLHVLLLLLSAPFFLPESCKVNLVWKSRCQGREEHHIAPRADYSSQPQLSNQTMAGFPIFVAPAPGHGLVGLLHGAPWHYICQVKGLSCTPGAGPFPFCVPDGGCRSSSRTGPRLALDRQLSRVVGQSYAGVHFCRCHQGAICRCPSWAMVTGETECSTYLSSPRHTDGTSREGMEPCVM